LLDLVEAPFLRHRQAAQARPATRPGQTPARRPAWPPQAPARRLPTGADQRRLLRPHLGLLPRLRACRPAAARAAARRPADGHPPHPCPRRGAQGPPRLVPQVPEGALRTPCQGTGTITRLRDTNRYEDNRQPRTARGDCRILPTLP